MTDEFLQFWAAYPRKVGKLAAWREWQRQRPPVADVLATLAWQAPLWDDPHYTPHPRTWLHQGRWMDERPPVVAPRGVVRHLNTWRPPEEEVS